ncbi:hypothetical protein SO802_015876 [Lithocarpus litseifolius]|uniref:Peptidase C1A papain C-terminal domain-containing protein n=1 Tax=Lithocarpus litseifolius TaxID=425828 RepID=A0AAW2CZ22_9ROSI
MSRTLQDEMYERHEQRMDHYGRVYKDTIEKEQRYKIFKENVAYIESFNNAANKPYKLNQGCEGGLMDSAFQFIEDNHGLTTKASYPYKGVDGTCNTNQEEKHAATINGHEDVPSNNEQALLMDVSSQPISVAIDARRSDFQFYLKGVFTGARGTSLDHRVTTVGYGVSNDGTKYWLVKNSWGTQ